VANDGPHTREEVAAVLGLSDERLRQIEKRAFARLKRNKTLRRLHDESF
jgi:DNA-directed RNA polymerase sigma subunit (sigma70/sigma32)